MHQSNAALTLRSWWEKPAANDECASGKLFPGQYYDAETQLHYNYFRDYDPSTGRYIESDPIGQFDDINTYSYVDENPLKYADIYGLAKCCVDTVVGYDLGCLQKLTKALTDCINLYRAGNSLGDGLVDIACSAVIKNPRGGGLCDALRNGLGPYMEKGCENLFNQESEKQCAVIKCI